MQKSHEKIFKIKNLLAKGEGQRHLKTLQALCKECRANNEELSRSDGKLLRNILKINLDEGKERLWLASLQEIKISKEDNNNNRSQLAQAFQYWSQGEPPSSVKENTAVWNKLLSDHGYPNIETYSKKSALTFLEENQPGLIDAFTSAYHYASEADIFRIAYAASNNDCIWIDSDLPAHVNSMEAINKVFTGARKSMFLFRWMSPAITNSFFATQANSPFFSAIVSSMKGYSFRNKPKTGLELINSFGPGKFNNMLNIILNNIDARAESRGMMLEPIPSIIDCTERGKWTYYFASNMSLGRKLIKFNHEYKSDRRTGWNEMTF
ncbi:hypothetical protein FZZ91_00540 [Synechococcus sp. HB1133]|uniref:hypothetical protein n=1 Tax=unclassified Synechococcus TaxID=2626047 RepID=UPI00140832BD|nr:MULTISPECIES: hypothetical protein [unclassified Synechococcus]MCB4393844.1 hypothetical protein [Synechococcus sp. PH41509]MCB4421324.1 hypothetical protein [Synechococcus sp. HB1133]MCB4431325.1 hypothetical protein [Synechococcus sp. HBA1120]NHI80266.1 hypothetical protein [Synechococcus sp. HB1133]